MSGPVELGLFYENKPVITAIKAHDLFLGVLKQSSV
jgi:hypothetical protein